MTDTVLILSVETATLGGSVCLARGDVVLTCTLGVAEVSHSNSLLTDVNECLEKAGVSLKDVHLFAAASGPGSFTGLRIGLATTKALAATLGRSCVGIPTLNAVAHAAGHSGATVALLPAGRGEVFVQMFSAHDRQVEPLDKAAHLSPQKVLDKYGSIMNLKWCGEGAHKYRKLLEEYAHGNGIAFSDTSLDDTSPQQGWILAREEKNLSKHVAALAFRQLESNEVVDAHALSAIYVRPSDAELKCP